MHKNITLVQLNYEDIIQRIVNDKGIREIAYKIANNSALSEDLYQEIILTILEKERELIMKLEKKNQLNFFIVRTAILMYRTKNSQFAQKYKHLPELMDREFKAFKECMEVNRIVITDTSKLSKLNELSWYEKELCKVYANLGSARKVEQQTGISYRSVAHTIKQVKHKLN